MSIPPVIRIFFAIDLPASAKEKLGGFIGGLKRRSKSNSIRWTRPENLHITLQFLAEVKSEHVPRMVEKVRAKIEGALQPSTLKFGEPHLFPNPFRPRVIVLNLEPQAELALLAKLIGESIKAMGYEIENRPFRGHLTIGRIKQPQGLDLKFLSEFSAPDMEMVQVNEVILFRSQPQPEGSKYTILDTITLINTPSPLVGEGRGGG